MDKLTKVIIVVLGVLALVFGTLYFATPKPVPPFGAVPVLNSPLEVNGTKVYLSGNTLKTGTTTPFALQAPSATTTIALFSCRLETSSTTASYVTLAKGATMTSTTTVLSAANLAANAKGTVTASTTVTTALIDTPIVLAPSTNANPSWLVMSMTGGGGTFSPVGKCVTMLIEN